MPRMAEFSTADLAAIETATQALGGLLFDRARAAAPSPLARAYWDDRLMQWLMRDEGVKVQAFRFVDVLPMLPGARGILGHLKEYFAGLERRLPWFARRALSAAEPGHWFGDWLAEVIRTQAASNARRFIAGTNVREVLAAAQQQRALNRAFTLDVLGEAVTSDLEAERYLASYLELIRGVAPTVNAWPRVPLLDEAGGRPLPRMNVSVKLSALDSQFDAIDHDAAFARVAPRLRTLLRAARAERAFINFDMESYAKKDLVHSIVKRILMEDEFRDSSDYGIVVQCYLRDALDDLAALHVWARQRGRPIWVRLVKGAYWDYETVHAWQEDWPVPVFQEKWQSDATFEAASRYILKAYPDLYAAFGSHNLRSLAQAIATARHLGLPQYAYELQMLYGMADAEKQVFVDLGQRMRIYMPYGELIPGMAYLVRRLLENTSNDSFLKAGFSDHISPETLLMKPEAARRPPLETDHHGPAAPATAAAADSPSTRASDCASPPFRNEPHTDFARLEHQAQMRAALASVRGRFGRHYPLVIQGRRVDVAERIASLNPSQITEVIGTAAAAGEAEANAAVEAARAAQAAWAARPMRERTQLLVAAAAELRKRRFELAAWMVYESGKPWREADGDVAEAIDFCEYYALAGAELERRRGLDIPGEENRFRYQPRGVTAVISPWNFPLAILCGMTTAALVTGNTVVMKPAEQSPIIAAQLMEVFEAAGFPPGVVNYLPGQGEIAGAALVKHPDVALIVFTGSRQVGLAIHAAAAVASQAALRPFVKRVIAEMGGKNAIIVDDDADLDEAVVGVMTSAFGYAGQKCSACSRAIVLASVHDAFVERLVEATRSLEVGPAEVPTTRVGPVIDEDSVRRVRRYVQLGRDEGREVLSVSVAELASAGYFVGPHIFTGIQPQHDLAQQEIFGPVLAILKANDFTEAIAIANQTDYALTGGVFSRSPAHLEQAAREFNVGNLYLNRAITGALVGRQPFGGFKLSGIGSQAGGPDYLLQFVVPRTITENTMRRGFAPSDPVAAERRGGK